jgi:hypothetical protein
MLLRAAATAAQFEKLSKALCNLHFVYSQMGPTQISELFCASLERTGLVGGCNSWHWQLLITANAKMATVSRHEVVGGLKERSSCSNKSELSSTCRRCRERSWRLQRRVRQTRCATKMLASQRAEKGRRMYGEIIFLFLYNIRYIPAV